LKSIKCGGVTLIVLFSFFSVFESRGEKSISSNVFRSSDLARSSIWPNNDQGLEDLARYIIRACFSQQRMTYISAADTLDGQAKVIYRSKDGRTSKTFEALDWLAQLVTHIPNKGEQMVRYYGYYSNKSRGMRKKARTDDQVPALIESAESSAAFRRNWARLIQKIYEIDPLLCPKCLVLIERVEQ
jgi:hypothetical protein